MNKFIRPPSLSTSFSENGNNAKKRFDNILNTKTKKAGALIFVLILFLTGIFGVAFSNISANNQYELKADKLKLLSTRMIGADMATLDYASDDKVVFHYGYALIVYDIKNSKIDRAIDLSKLNVPINTQGDSVINVRASVNGNEIFIGHYESFNKNYENYIYNIEKNTIAKTDKKDITSIFSGLSDMDTTNIKGWNSIHCVKLSENKRCYLLLSDGPNVENIKIIIEDGKNTKSYPVFEGIGAEINRLLNIIQSSPLTSSNPNDYIKVHQTEFDKIVEMDTSALSYMFNQFETSDHQNRLRENIMMIACKNILGEENIKYNDHNTSNNWHYTLRNYLIHKYNLNGYDYVKINYPKASILLDIIINQINPVSKEAYTQILDYMSNEINRTYSQHYIIVDQFPFAYKENINGNDFEAIFGYKMIDKNFYKDPDTVGYIKQAKESNNPSYQALYDDYNSEHEGNYNLRVTAKILPDGKLDMSTFKLYSNSSPSGAPDWDYIKDFKTHYHGD